MSDTRANIEVTASSNRLAAGLRSAMSRVQAFARGVGASMSKITGNSTFGNIAGNLAGRGIDFAADQARNVARFEETMTRLGISSGQSAADMQRLASTARQLSSQYGIDANVIANAASSYFDLTSDVAGSAEAIRAFTRVAAASGAELDDITRTAASMKDAFNINTSDLESAFSGLIEQSSAGSVTMKELGSELTALAPKFAKFGGAKGRDGLMQLHAALQVAYKGFGTASGAATGLEALMGALAQNADKFAAANVKIFDVGKDGSKTFRNFRDIIVDISNSRLAKDPTLLVKAFGSKEALGAYSRLADLRDLYDQVARAGENTDAVQRRSGAYLASSSGKIAQSFEQMKNKIAEAFTPERIEAFVGGLTFLVDKLAKAVGYLDRAAKFVEKVGDAPRKDIQARGRLDARRKEQEQLESGKSGLETSQWMLTEAARLERDAQEGGVSGLDVYRREAEVEVLRTRGQALRNRSDPWLGMTPGGTTALPNVERFSMQQRADVGYGDFFNQLSRVLESSIERGMAKAKPPDLKTNNETLARGVNKSTNARRG